MSTNILSAQTSSSPGAASSEDDVRVTFPRVVTSEWIKFRTLRSTVWTLATTVVLMVGIALLFAFGLKSAAGAGADTGPVPIPGVTVVTGGYYFGQLALAVLGVLIISGEYTTGMIRSTLAAVPTRLPALWAKALVLFVASFVVSLVAVGISYLVTQPILSSIDLVPDLGDPESLRIIFGAALFLSMIALLAFALGALLRHSAAALAAVFGLLLVVPIVFQVIPGAFFAKVGPFLPSNAGAQLMTSQEQIDALRESATAAAAAGAPSGAILDPWQGLAVLVAWVVVILATAAVLLRRRNA